MDALTGDNNSQNQIDKFCYACLQENESESAFSWCKDCMEALCEACSKYHHRQTATKWHKMVSIDTISTEEISVCGDIFFCAEHSGRRIEFHCTDHDAPSCSACVIIYHRNCRSVDTIENAAKFLRGSTIHSQFQDKLKQREYETIEKIQKQSDMISNIENDVVQVTEEISDFAKSIIDHVRTLEENCMQNVINETTKHVEELQCNQQRLESQANSLKQYRETIVVSAKHGSEISLFILLKQAQILCGEIDAASNVTSDLDSTPSLIFEKDSKAQELKSCLSTLGTIKISQEGSATTGTPIDETASKLNLPYLESETREKGMMEVNFMAADPIPLKVLNSPLGAEVSGIAFIDAERFIVADRSNPRCILSDVNGKVIKVFKLESNPFGIDYLNETEVVISFRKRQFVQTLDIQSLKLGKKIPLLYPCTSLASSMNGLVYASSDQAIHRFDAQGTDDVLVKCNGSYCVAVTKDGTILYANLGESTLIAVTGTGDEKYRFSHSKLRSPFSITLDYQGNSYVIGLESRNIHQISADGTQGRILLEEKVGGGHTCCIKFKPKSNVFVTASENGTKLTFYEIK